MPLQSPVSVIGERRNRPLRVFGSVSVTIECKSAQAGLKLSFVTSGAPNIFTPSCAFSAVQYLVNRIKPLVSSRQTRLKLDTFVLFNNGTYRVGKCPQNLSPNWAVVNFPSPTQQSEMLACTLLISWKRTFSTIQNQKRSVSFPMLSATACQGLGRAQKYRFERLSDLEVFISYSVVSENLLDAYATSL